MYEETGLTNDIGELLKENEDIFAVARSTPARWLEKYYLVNCASSCEVFSALWTEEEKSTIQKWKLWSLEEIGAAGNDSFKPEWLPELLNEIIESKMTA